MRYTIYIQDKDMDLLGHIKSKPNTSRYILDLVRIDMMQKDDKITLDRNELRKIISEYIEKIKNTPNNEV